MCEYFAIKFSLSFSTLGVGLVLKYPHLMYAIKLDNNSIVARCGIYIYVTQFPVC